MDVDEKIELQRGQADHPAERVEALLRGVLAGGGGSKLGEVRVDGVRERGAERLEAARAGVFPDGAEAARDVAVAERALAFPRLLDGGGVGLPVEDGQPGLARKTAALVASVRGEGARAEGARRGGVGDERGEVSEEARAGHRAREVADRMEEKLRALGAEKRGLVLQERVESGVERDVVGVGCVAVFHRSERPGGPPGAGLAVRFRNARERAVATGGARARSGQGPAVAPKAFRIKRRTASSALRARAGRELPGRSSSRRGARGTGRGLVRGGMGG